MEVPQLLNESDLTLNRVKIETAIEDEKYSLVCNCIMDIGQHGIGLPQKKAIEFASS